LPKNHFTKISRPLIFKFQFRKSSQNSYYITLFDRFIKVCNSYGCEQRRKERGEIKKILNNQGHTEKPVQELEEMLFQ